MPGLTSDRHELVYSRGGRLDASHAHYRSSTPPTLLTVFGAPIAFAITGFLHLVADGDAPDIYTGLKGHAGLWIAIHVVQLLLILLLAVAVYWLTEGLTSTAARISRVALLPYLVFYSAFDAVVGLSNGLAVKYGSELPASRAGRANRGQRRPCQPHTSTRAPHDLSHWHLVVGGRHHRRCSCVEPSRSSANCNDPTCLPELSEQSIMLRLLDRSRCCYLSSPPSCSVERALSGLRLT